MKEKIYGVFHRCIIGVFAAIVAVILALLIFLSNGWEYACKLSLALPNGILVLIAIATAALAVVVYVWKKGTVDRWFSLIPRRSILVLTGALFAVQAWCFYNIFFETGWDASMLVNTARSVVNGEQPNNLVYYSMYPNNLMLTWIFSTFFRISEAIGFSSIVSELYFVVLIQSLLSCVSGYLLFNIARDLTKNPVFPYVVWFLFVMNIAMSPWLTITYSDAMVLCFPIAIIRLYQLTFNGRWVCLKWCFIGGLSYFGYTIKPQVLIALIAVIIVDLIRLVLKLKGKERIQRTVQYACCVLSIIVVMLGVGIVVDTLPFDTDPDRAFGLTHFAMMGLNSETDGVYLEEDVQFSDSFDTPKERTQGNLRVIRERLKEFGVGGYIKHLMKKSLVIYGDGTYAWGMEGSFYKIVPEPPNDTVAPFLRSFYYEEGSRYTNFVNFEQYLWMVILIGCLGTAFCLGHRQIDAFMLVAILSLIGLTLFQLLFEARARYLFIYSPIFLLVSVWGCVIKSTERT